VKVSAVHAKKYEEIFLS